MIKDEGTFFSLTFLRDTVVPESSLGLSIHMKMSSQDGAGVCGASTHSGNLISEPASELGNCLMLVGHLE